ncbi:Hypothetical protein R9X50_00309800 [Acrodontium crateriforme]|uniref:LEM-like domain-containing protein n=1 Tax=Acrodontium crateriforme TaxID=150365 RepID=A0AAQ3M280_9PEZI|nr:Hypothetical protein R9X50_00309800 [Acrodontium crateriforme]
MDDQPYFEEGFDPNTLVVPRLRSILVAHNVAYPSSAKKSQLVDLFNENIVPQARAIRQANARVRRTSRGIVDQTSGRTGSGQGDYDDEEEDEVPEPPRTAPRSSRRSTRARTEEVEEATPALHRSTRHSTAPPEHTPLRSSVKHARASDVNPEPESKRRVSSRPSSRGNVATPKVKNVHEDDDNSPFSYDNVFQSGGSPPVGRPASRSRDADRRRSAMSAAKETERRLASAIRRRTEDARPLRQVDGAIVPSRSTFEMPISALRRDEVEPTEEFTAEESQELVEAEQAGELVRTPRRAHKRKGGGIAPWAVTVAMLAGLATVWRQEKLEVGYCGVGRPTTELAGVQIPDWADLIRPQCEPCPQHAYCGDHLETACEPDFVLTNHPLSLNGLFPLAPTCEPDSAKARRVNLIRERAVEELRQQNAKYECGEAASPVLEEPVLKHTMAAKRRKGMSQDEFDDLWESAIGDIRTADEIVLGSAGTEGSFTLRSTSLVRLPLACAIRRSLRATLRQYIWPLVAIFFLASSGLYTQRRITSGRTTESQAKQLARLALDKLSEQASLHAADPSTYRESYISVAQLRDDVLRDEFRPDRRRKLWEAVQRKVEANSNVRPMVREGRSGDVGRVWEWVGAVSRLESPPSAFASGNKEKKRVSFGVPNNGRRLIKEEESGDESLSMIKRETPTNAAKWEEGRQYF